MAIVLFLILVMTEVAFLISEFAKEIEKCDIDPEQCTNTLNQLILDFYNCYLKDQGEFSAQEHY